MTATVWKIIQVFNNSVVLAERGTDRAVLLGRGIGFGRAPGAAVQESAVQEHFRASGMQPPEHLARLIAELNPELIALARELAENAHFMCDVEIPDSTVIAMADHIRFAIDRAAQGISLPNPLRWEVSQFYPREYAFGIKALQHIKKASQVALPEEEAISLALHVVNAQFAQNSMQNTMSRTAQLTALLAQVFDVIETALPNHEIDRDSTAAARFVTHLRYLLQRMIARGRDPHQVEDAMLSLSTKVADEYPVAYAIAGKVIMMLQMELDTNCSDDEVVYLSLHIARLMRTPR
ncbi:PRD domain-containing protein [Corynebacterium callunae]|uniref:PRD domain-containing protein n=1 Tax=Corynebacterium callunae TaxID=1721 RepID=UPI003981C0EF